MRAFVRAEIWPIEAIQHDIGQAGLERIYAPLQRQVRERGLWAAHLPPELGGQGFGQVQLGLMNEILGSSVFAPNAFGCQAPDSGNSEILALAGTPEQKERWLEPLLAGDLKSAFSIADFLIVMAVTDPDARPHQRASMFLVDADTPGVRILRDVPTMEHPWESF